MSNIIMHPNEQKRQARKKLTKVANKLSWVLDQIIMALDEIDDDPELEPDLGASEVSYFCYDQTHWAQGSNDNREFCGEDVGELDYSECEPSLGATENQKNQKHWGLSDTTDFELNDGYDA